MAMCKPATLLPCISSTTTVTNRFSLRLSTGFRNSSFPRFFGSQVSGRVAFFAGGSNLADGEGREGCLGLKNESWGGVGVIVKRSPKRLKYAAGGNHKNLLPFVKYHGLGNDFILVDNRQCSTLCITAEQAAKLCDRNFGVGGDGVIFVLPGVNGSDYSMRIINSDGSEPEMCGNGIRCMAKFIAELEGATEARSYKVDTLAGLIVPELRKDGQVCVDMGPPILEAKKIPTTLEPTRDGVVVKAPLVVAGRPWSVTCVSMGNPHCVVLLDASEDVYSLPLSDIGPLFEKNEVFPARINTEFVQVLTPSHLRMRVWERGAGPTLACGTGACALVVAAVLEGRAERNCLVELPGGPLQIDWRESDNHVYMTGPAEIAFQGTAYLYN